MSRRQFLKLTGKAAAAAASPQSALKGLVGGAASAVPGMRVAVAIHPDLDNMTNVGNALGGIQGAINAAKALGGGKVGGASSGCGDEFEIITFSDTNKIKQLVKDGKIKQVTSRGEMGNLDTFGKPLSKEEVAAITQRVTQETLKHLSTDPYRDYRPSMKPVSDITNAAEVREYVNGRVQNELDGELEARSELRFYDEAGNNYWVTADNDVMQNKINWFQEVVNMEDHDFLGDWWEMYFGYSDFSDIEFSKPALEFIKKKGLYRRVDDPFGMRKLMDAFEEFKVAPPADIDKVLERFRTRPSYHDTASKWHTKYDDIKPGEDFYDYKDRKEAEEEAKQRKQKQEFDQAPPPSDEPDSWRTQSVEFESKLRRLVR